MELLFDKNRQLSVHKTTRRSDFCCCYAKNSVTTAVLDLTLARCLLINCCIDMFWYSCLAFKGVTLEQFLNSNRHILYHLWKSNTKCCKCQPDFILPCNAPLIMESEWKKMFNSTLPPCENDRKRPAIGAMSICSFTASQCITVQQIHFELQNIIIQCSCSTRKSVEKLVELRNLTFGHAKKASMSCTEFNTFMSEAEDAILDIATVCGKEDYYRQMLLDLRDKPLDSRMFCQYEKVLLRTISNYEDIIKDNEVLKDGIDSLEEKIEKLDTSQREGSKRQRLIDETIAEIDNHRKDQTYTEIQAVTACLQMLDNSKVLILSGREGSGKSRNSLEILRQMKEKDPEIDVIKLNRLTQFSDIIEKDANTIVFFEDVFGRTRKQFCDDTDIPILDSLHSYISLRNVRVIFVMRNSVKRECQSILSSHDIFCNNTACLDLDSKEFELSLMEKERIFIDNCMNCTHKEIDITYRKKFFNFDANVNSISIEEIKVSMIDKLDVSCHFSADNKCIVFNSRDVTEMIRSDPYHGFPKCCRLFTENRKFTLLGAAFFKYPLKSLLQEIENMRREGMDNVIKGIKYVILVYILLNQTRASISLGLSIRFAVRQTTCFQEKMLSMDENSIDIKAFRKLVTECYERSSVVMLHDIKYFCKELTCRYLSRQEKELYFQHRAIQDSVLISYYKINPRAIIPLLSFDHMVDIVRQQNSMEQEDEIVIKIEKTYYHELATKIISFMNNNCAYNKTLTNRLIESKIITENDEDLIFQLIDCIHKTPTQTPSYNTDYTVHYFPLLLLKNIRKLDDNKLTVNHTHNEMLISVVIGDQESTFSIDPSKSLIRAFDSKYEDIVKWVLQNTNHSLLNLNSILATIDTYSIQFEHVQVLLQNVNHDNIDIAEIMVKLSHQYYDTKYHVIDWILDNVDHSSINFTRYIENLLDNNCYESIFTDLILHILRNINRKWLDIYRVVKMCCKRGFIDIIQWVSKNYDHEVFENDELIDILISLEFILFEDQSINQIVYLLLSTTGVKYSDVNRLVAVAAGGRWYEVLELVFVDTIEGVIDINKVIEDAFKELDYYDDRVHWKTIVQLILKHLNLNDVCLNKIMAKTCEIDESNLVQFLLEQFDQKQYNLNLNRHVDVAFNGRCCAVLEILFKHDIDKSIEIGTIIEYACNRMDDVNWYHSKMEQIMQLSIKYYVGYIDVQKIIEKACATGFHDVVKDFVLDTVDNIPLYLDITLNSLMTQQVHYSSRFEKSHEKILLLLLQSVNDKTIDLTRVMTDMCSIGHSSAVKWLLENKPVHFFDIRNVMDKACYHGDLELVYYLLRKYSAADFDFFTAMITACRKAQKKSLDVCKWVWENIDHDLLDIKASLNNASRFGNTVVVEWILTDVDIMLIDTEAALLCACEHGSDHTVQLLMDKSGLNTFDFQYACTLACRNDYNGYTIINKLLYKCADKSTIDLNAVLSVACKNYRTGIVHWIIETCDQSKTVNETNDGNKNCNKRFDKHLVDIDRALTCILHMNAPVQRKGHENATKKELVWLILKQCDPKAIYIYELLAESCKKDWIGIFQWILRKVDNSGLNVGEIINVACKNRAFKIVKWSLENIDIQLLDANNVMIGSCGTGWLECLVLVQKHCNQYKLHAAMIEACTHGHLCIANWLLNNCNYQCFNLQLLLKETGRNGWTHIFVWLVTNFHFYISDLQIATKEALVNGNLEIIKLMLLVVGRDAFDLSSLSNEEFADLKNENVVNFVLRHFDSRCLDLNTIMANACKFGWIDIVAFIIDNDSNCLSDSALDLIDISSFITGKHVNCLCDFTSAFNTACDNGEAEIVQLLIVNVNHKIFAVQKAMLSVCIKGWDEIAVLLLDKVKHTRLDIGNALIEACRHGEIDVAQTILRKVDTTMLDAKTAVNIACENHMHEELVLWVLENIHQKEVDLKTVKIQAIRNKWRKVQFALTKVVTKDLNQVDKESATDSIIFV
ncbi:uncharacterized protein LOC127705286 [Mytilus californianus]|uniref:uncharacterized protein LOC127705286 n=1 Tax=Mytilus californianus TaxID=6549 RepID=UPI002247FD33|nr:uncharacterized protein LOC127705286 [Mytilus californianus]